MRVATGQVPLPEGWINQLLTSELAQLTFQNAVAMGLSQESSAVLAHWTLRGQQVNNALLNDEVIDGVPAAQFSVMLRDALALLPRTTETPHALAIAQATAWLC